MPSEVKIRLKQSGMYSVDSHESNFTNAKRDGNSMIE